MTRRLLLALAVLVFGIPPALLATAQEALACSCAPQPLSAQVERSAVVFTGEAIERARLPPRADVVNSLDPATWTFRVDEVHKGSAGERQPVVSALSEASCGMEFEIGTTYFVLADEEPDGSLSTGLCHGNHVVAAQPAAALDTDEAARAPGAPGEPAAVLAPAAVAWWQLGVAGLLVLVVAGFAVGAALRRRRS